jgi:hypothetical protein
MHGFRCSERAVERSFSSSPKLRNRRLSAREASVTYSLTVDEKPTHLHVVVTGSNTRGTVERYLADLLRECQVRNCFRILLEERLEGPRLNTVDVFQIVARGTERTPGLLSAVAFVDVNAEGDLMRFAETVAVNRGFPLKVFSNVADAEKWLLTNSGENR